MPLSFPLASAAPPVIIPAAPPVAVPGDGDIRSALPPPELPESLPSVEPCAGNKKLHIISAISAGVV